MFFNNPSRRNRPIRVKSVVRMYGRPPDCRGLKLGEGDSPHVRMRLMSWPASSRITARRAFSDDVNGLNLTRDITVEYRFREANG
jgi:hypothetical protein